jgi:RP/EB family microtubule-associated protein
LEVKVLGFAREATETIETPKCKVVIRSVRLSYHWMSRTTAAVNAAYSTSRGELLDWTNSLLGTHYTKVEETSNGAAYCQIFDALNPGKVKLRKVNFNAVTEPEMVANYKVLQEVFNSEKIPRDIPVETLTKGRYMAALEMLQWIKGYFDQYYCGGEYDGGLRRSETGVRDPGESARGGKKGGSQNQNATGNTKAAPRPTPARTPRVQVSAPAPPPTAAKPKTPMAQTPAQPSTRPVPTSARAPPGQLQKVREELEQTKTANQNLLEERNFYYGKLQRLEAMCQARSEDEFAASVLKVLYETDAEHGFVSPDELDI